MEKSEFPFVEIRNPQFSLARVKALLFDLDDTIYCIPSGAHFSRYGEHLSTFLPEDEKDGYLDLLQSTWNDNSGLKVGRSFDPSTGWVLSFDDDWKLNKAFTLEGREVPNEVLERHYKLGTPECELTHATHLSSGWGIPSALGRFKGLTNFHYRQAYLATRADMKEKPEIFPLICPIELPRFFAKLHQEGLNLIVATNSDLEDAYHVLDTLCIREFFHKVYAQAKKPTHSQTILKEIISTFHIQYSELLVVGDSVYNDLREAKNLECQTVLIERFSNQPLGLVDVRVNSFDGFINLWNEKRGSHGRQKSS